MKKKKMIKSRSFEALSAWNRKAGAHKDKSKYNRKRDKRKKNEDD